MLRELSMLFDTARSIAWVAFGAAFLLATGLAISGGRNRSAEANEAEAERRRKAA